MTSTARFFLVLPQPHAQRRDPTATGSRRRQPSPKCAISWAARSAGPSRRTSCSSSSITGSPAAETFPLVSSVINSSVNQTTQSWIGLCGAGDRGPVLGNQRRAGRGCLAHRCPQRQPDTGSAEIGTIGPDSRNALTVDMNLSEVVLRERHPDRYLDTIRRGGRE